MGDFKKFIKAFELLTEKPPSNNSLENRIIVQKIAYLLQKKGIQFGYSFGWYIYGVFSRDLWRDNLGNSDSKTSRELSPVELVTIDTLKHQSVKNTFSNSDELELVTSILYWAEKQSKPINDEEVLNLVRATKPRFKDSEYSKAVEIATSF